MLAPVIIAAVAGTAVASGVLIAAGVIGGGAALTGIGKTLHTAITDWQDGNVSSSDKYESDAYNWSMTTGSVLRLIYGVFNLTNLIMNPTNLPSLSLLPSFKSLAEFGLQPVWDIVALPTTYVPAITEALSLILFAKKLGEGGFEKIKSGKGNTPNNNQAQNKQNRSIANKADPPLTKAEQRVLHDAVGGQGYGY